MDKIRKTYNLIRSICLLVIAMILFSACGASKDQVNENATFTTRPASALANKEEEPEELPEEEPIAAPEELYIVESVDTSQETIVVYSLKSDRELRFSYNLATSFKDKYGKRMNSLNFVPGSVVVIGDLLPDSGAISSVQMSTTVWNYSDLSKYAIDVENNILDITGTKYKITSDTRAYSGNDKIELTDISGEDVVSVTGLGKEIISVLVTSGHGYVELTNTELFVDSLIFIGPKIATVIYGDGTLQIPEGTYTITVANDGWGGSGEYTVKRNEVTKVNLDDIKGEGPKYCKLSFDVLVPSCSIFLDGFKVDAEETQEVRYGTHTLKVMADGYESWTKTLIVNSESATISLDLTSESQKADSVSTQGNTNNVSLDSNSINQLAEALKDNTKTDEKDTELDYLTTLSNMISTIME